MKRFFTLLFTAVIAFSLSAFAFDTPKKDKDAAKDTTKAASKDMKGKKGISEKTATSDTKVSDKEMNKTDRPSSGARGKAKGADKGKGSDKGKGGDKDKDKGHKGGKKGAEATKA